MAEHSELAPTTDADCWNFGDNVRRCSRPVFSTDCLWIFSAGKSSDGHRLIPIDSTHRDCRRSDGSLNVETIVLPLEAELTPGDVIRHSYMRLLHVVFAKLSPTPFATKAKRRPAER